LALVGLGLDLRSLNPCARERSGRKELAEREVSNDVGPKASDEYLLNVVDAIDQAMAR
jgi:hypothetical protein